MRSLRARILTLVVAVVLGALTLLTVLGTRSARIAFRTVEQIRTAEIPRAAPDAAWLDTAFAEGGWDSVRARLRARPPGRDDGFRVVVDAAGTLVVVEDSLLRGAAATLGPGPRLRLERRAPGQAAVVVIAPGEAIRTATGDTAGWLFSAPAPGIDTLDPERVFRVGLDRRLWVGAAVLLVAAMLLAWAVTGRLLAPVHRLAAAVERVSRGDYGAPVGRVSPAELEPLGLAIDRMADRLRQAEAERQRLIRDVAHELRTPLTNLRGQVEALQDGLRAPDAEALASLHEETRLLEHLVEDLGELARADAGRLETRPVDLPLRPVLARAIEAFVRGGRVAPGRMTLEVPETLRATADPERLGQILRNLLENAVVHGGGQGPISVTAGAEGDMVRVTVADRGAGMAPEHLPRLGERFYRPDPSRSRDSGGAGLGLAIVRALVAVHGGTVEVRSAPGEGTTVAFTLPRAVPTA